jgi:hypothetical protein
LATYPVYNKVTGEQKEIILSVHDWEQWKKITLNGIVIGLIPQLAHRLENWVRYMINLRNLIPDGTMSFHEHQKFLDQK